MKNNLFKFSMLLCLLISCKQTNRNDVSKEVITQGNPFIQNKVKQGENFLIDFYTKYYSEYRDNEGMEKYVSSRILNRIDSLSSEDNLTLDYNPFIQGQDWDANLLMSTLDIKPLNNDNEYRVSFLSFQNKDKTNIDLLLKMSDNGDFLIYSILNDKYLNFKQNEINDNSKKQTLQSNLKGVWSVSCQNELTEIEINNSEGFLSLYDFNAIYINLKVEKSLKENQYDLKFANTSSQSEFYKDKLKIIDEDISKDDIIGSLILKENNKAELSWVGLYNIKKRKLEFVGKDFLLIKENGGKHPVLLEKCD